VQQKLAVLSPGCLLLAIQDHPPLNNTCVHSWEIGLVVKIKKKKHRPNQHCISKPVAARATNPSIKFIRTAKNFGIPTD
jgi:subtilisin-like proprotein convertase family protein